MKNVEIKYISPTSVFRLFGGVAILLGVAGGIYGALSNQLDIPSFLSNLPFLSGVGAMGKAIFLGGMTGAIYGFVIGLAYAVIATLYNIFSNLFGGVDITLHEN